MDAVMVTVMVPVTVPVPVSVPVTVTAPVSVLDGVRCWDDFKFLRGKNEALCR